jgi:hypothetical protein
MKIRYAVAGIAVLCALVLPLSLTVGQDAGGDGEKESPAAKSGSGILALVSQIEGEKTEVKDALFMEEKLGILSLTKDPSSSYTFLRGRANVTVQLHQIQRMEFDSEKVRIKGIDGKTIEGDIDKNRRYFLTGQLSFGAFEVEISDVRSLEFTHPKVQQKVCPSCNRLYIDPDWKYCPYEGAKLNEVK